MVWRSMSVYLKHNQHRCAHSFPLSLSHTLYSSPLTNKLFYQQKHTAHFEGVYICERIMGSETNNSGDDVIWIVQPNWVAQLILINSTSRAANFLQHRLGETRLPNNGEERRTTTTFFVCGCPLIANQRITQSKEIKSLLRDSNIFVITFKIVQQFEEAKNF